MIVTVASGPYAHLAALGTADHSDGLQVRHEVLEPGQIFPRMLREAAWDVAEMSLATIYILAASGDRRFVPLPVFPSRAFRHSALYVPAASRVREVADLRGGARIGVLRYAMTTAVWVRAMLREPYGIPADGLRWYVGDASAHPRGVEPVVVEGAAALERMAIAGELDCLISGRTPAGFHDGRLRRLFPDFGLEEKQYYARTRVFPIMHVMAARRELVERNARVVPDLMARFHAAKHAAEEGLLNFDISTYPVPWLPSYLEDARGLMGPELWPYGVHGNRETLRAFGAALAADGLAQRTCTPEEVFGDG
jgi:4,5-dihydroxyphthalate decarboxylase